MIKKLKPHSVNNVFANCSYLFYVVEVEDEILLSGMMERTIYCASGSFTLDHISIGVGDSIDVRNREIVLKGSGKLYIAQVPASPGDLPDSIARINREGTHYTVTKPWGYEIWINGQHPRYAMKRIFIKAGNKTSLQYHNFKEETTVIESGNIEFVSQRDIAMPMTSENVISAADVAPVSYHITPKTLHRIIATTDVMMMEVSTPFLDDVVRIQDDSARGDGRIESEHQK